MWFIWIAPNKEEKNLVPTVKHGSSSIMIWGCFVAVEIGKIVHIDSTVDSERYQAILNERVLSSVKKLSLVHG